MRMKKPSKKIFVFAAAFFALQNAFCAESVENLLQSYLKNNLSLSKLSSQVENQILQKNYTQIENGFNIKFSSGTVKIQFDQSPQISFSPSASFTLPQASNLTFSVSSDFELENQTNISNTALSLSADLYSNSMTNRKITLDKAERELLEMQRSLQNGFVSAETEFYEELKNLYEIAASVESSQNDLYEDALDFEQIKTQGYSSSSSKYRLAQMKVLSDQHTVEQYEHNLLSQVKIFASKCGIDFENENALDFLPQEIPQIQVLNVESFAKENFTQIEQAVWEHSINQKIRESDKAISVKANAGYTFENEIRSDSYADTIDAGTSLTWNETGLTANFGVSLPINDFNPVYEFGISINPQEFALSSISKKQKELESKQEEISIKDAENVYETTVISQRSELNEIQFNKSKNLETYELYNQLEKDMAVYYERGLISESEYKSAKASKENYRIQCIINDIELIIYNNNTMQLFNRDEELIK